ncbi:MAG: MBOAT family protein [Magnetococcales bacterium]|nr:MBOAT family protein [Magnetococcales bacterium]
MAKFQQRKKLFLIISLTTNLGLLGVFKYYGFFVDNVILLLTALGLPSFTNTIEILLPVGISFYTFQTLSYTIDVYRGRIATRYDFLDFALYVAFFPQLVAGPIERAETLLPQIEKKRTYSAKMTQDAIFLIMWGFFKKLVIADNVAIIVNMVFALEEPSFYILWAGVFAFSIQVIADFSAYTDIARGSAKFLGFNLMPNFNHPYLAVSPSDFWRRWHMSLTFWIRDYVFVPITVDLMRNNKTEKYSENLGVFITFILIGLWHGANWNFVLYGLYHFILFAMFPICGRHVSSGFRNSIIVRPFRILFMFILLNIGYLIFRGGELSLIIEYYSLSPFGVSYEERQMALFLFTKALLFSVPLWVHTLYAHVRKGVYFQERTYLLTYINILASIIMFLGILIMRSNTSNDFIYFQF